MPLKARLQEGIEMAYDSSKAVFENNDRLRIYPHFLYYLCIHFSKNPSIISGGMRIAQAESKIYPLHKVRTLEIYPPIFYLPSPYQ